MQIIGSGFRSLRLLFVRAYNGAAWRGLPSIQSPRLNQPLSVTSEREAPAVGTVQFESTSYLRLLLSHLWRQWRFT
jgi:hypothetical protein